MQKDKPRRFVRMFQPQFARLVESGKKCQTIRPTPKRMPEPGDLISLRCWTDRPYRSKQRVLREATITKTIPVEITVEGVRICGMDRHGNPDGFARADGFIDWNDLTDWFAKTHGLPFKGILICWENKREGGAE